MGALRATFLNCGFYLPSAEVTRVCHWELNPEPCERWADPTSSTTFLGLSTIVVGSLRVIGT